MIVVREKENHDTEMAARKHPVSDLKTIRLSMRCDGFRFLSLVDEWKVRPEQSDNHWLDCLVGCAVAASIQGAVLFGTGPAPVQKERKGRRRTLAEMRQQKRGY